MAECIVLEAAIEKTEVFCDVFVTKWTDEKVLAWIRNLPTIDAVPVVRCRDCVNGELCLNLQGAEYVVCGLDDHHVWLPNSFCSYGERRVDNAVD